ncbi:MAG: hypothetical protein KJ667_06765 [Alphaproteobacteria bacterium]|nr:hypothetical protein [Alphaproteobacteria bacterium]
MSRQIQKSGGQSLQDIMNMMAQRVDGLQTASPLSALTARGILSEAEAYAHFDPLLAQLLKHYRDAQSRYEELLRKNGSGDAMVDVAADMAASSDSAMETRLIELRTNNTMRRMAEARIRESIEMMNASTRYNEKLRNHALRRSGDIARQRMEEAREGIMWVWFLMMLLQDTLRETQRRLSAAQHFSRVSSHDDERRIVAA